MVVSQMLGLDATALTLPNSEIIKLLETILHNRCHHHHLHHHVNMPWHCAPHQGHHLQQIQDLPDGPTLDAAISGPVCPEGALPRETSYQR